MAGSLVKLLLSPSITGSLLLALSWGPESITAPVLEALQGQISESTLATTVKALQYLFGIGAARQINLFLTRWAKNNFRLNAEKYDWPKEIVVITGGTGGFGSLMSKRFADRGATVIALDVKNNLPEDLKTDSKIIYYECDITNRQKVMALRDRVVKEHGHPSVLINNAGLGLSGPVLECEESTVRKIVEVNFTSHYWTVQAFLPAMIEKRKGHIVTIASMAAFVAPPTMSMYSSTKAALLGFHEALTGELRKIYKVPEIKTTIVHPTWSPTAMIAGHTDRIKAAGMALIPPQQVADAIADQVLSGRGGGRLIVADPKGRIPEAFRALPSWITRALLG